MKNKTNRSLTVFLSLALVCMLTLCGSMAGSLLPAVAEGTAAAEPAYDPSPALYVAEKNANSVVGVQTNEQTWNRSTGEVEDTPVGTGSGVVIAEGGYILTNNHVVEGGMSYQILMPSGEKVDAWLVGADSSTDLAVLKVDEGIDELVPVTVGSIESVKVGATAIAIGNPGGETLANTVTQGVISALERTGVTAQNATRRISYIQHDASINSGNSGGGLFNYKGELIGINTLKYGSSAYSSVSFEGLGFAIPVSTAHDIALQLIENGKVIRPGLGVSVTDYTDGPDKPLPNNPPKSVAVMEVNEGGAAEKAGMKQYDFIYAVNGERVTCLLDLTGVLDQYEAGDTVSVTVIRYKEAGMYQPSSSMNSMFGYSFGYNFGSSSAQLMAGGGYEELTLDVTLETLQN